MTNSTDRKTSANTGFASSELQFNRESACVLSPERQAANR